MSDITVEVVAAPAIEVTVAQAGVPGMSAYQHAVANGFVGTEAEWLDSLHASGAGIAWGGITGTLTDQTDLATALSGKSATGHTHTEADVTGLTGDLAAKADASAVTTALAGKSAVGHTHAESDVTGLVSDLAGKAATVHTHAESDITGLVSDLAAKAPLASPAFTGTPTGITKSHVGLGNVDNTADTAKPVSTAQQTALDLKANLASPALTGNPTAPTATAGDNDTSIATTAFVATAVSGKLDTSAAPELIRDTIGTALVAGSGVAVAVDDSADTITVSSLATADYTKTTASLANNANESGTFTLGASELHEALVVTADRAARVRFYATTALRDADVSRAIGTDPTGNHGLLLEIVLTAGTLSYTVSPSARLFNQTTAGSAVPVTITNTSGSTSTVLVTVKAKGL